MLNQRKKKIHKVEDSEKKMSQSGCFVAQNIIAYKLALQKT